MTAEQVVSFLEALHAKQIHIKGNGWVEASCPLARWTHSHHKDSKPSFGISVVPGGKSYFLCFSCRQGSVEELLQTIEWYTKGNGPEDFARCRQILADEPQIVTLPPYQEFAASKTVFIEWPQYWVESFKRADWVLDAMTYLTSREVSPQTIETFDLRWDPKRCMIVAPYRDVYGRLAGARGRTILPTVGNKHYDYTFQAVNNARLVWYNEAVLNLPGPVVVVEGQFDCFRTVQAFPKTVAALTAKPTWDKMKKLGECGTVIQIPDRDEAGHQSVHRYAALCHQFNLQHRVVWLDEGVKDPAQCHVDYLRDRIQEMV